MPIEDPDGIETLKASSVNRPKILVCVPRYLPGFKSGGPIRSVSNMVADLSPHFQFYVVTRDRDSADTQTYPGIRPGIWHQVGDAQVLYCSAIRRPIMLRAYREVHPDAIMLNSFHDTFTRVVLLLRRSRQLGKIPIILAPRGEFSAGALRIRSWKKRLYRLGAQAIGLYDDVYWHATSPLEKSDVLRSAPASHLDSRKFFVAGNVNDHEGVKFSMEHPAKLPGQVKLIFLSRISEMKNLHFLLELLPHLRGAVQLNLFGPIADKDLPSWRQCEQRLNCLPENISARYHGPIAHAEVPRALFDHHFFVLPTKGENFCHSAVEAFIYGTPVVISDQTPWIHLSEAYAGFDIALSNRDVWIATLQKCVDMNQDVYNTYLNGSLAYGRQFSHDQAVREHLLMLRTVLNFQP
jgi:glycosyltransferase involved in cell wall biosynthesis